MVFQEIVNTYGVPMYKEANPAVFAIVTFPFLFGVMFGDVGHGFLLLLVGLILCVLHSKLKHVIALEAFFVIRYLLLLMGFFALIIGAIYNEFFAMPLEIFGKSCYEDDVKVLTVRQEGTLWKPEEYGYKRISGDCIYPFGFDPKWGLSDQLLTYTNNFKMKTAVIFAIIQMSLGICMKGFNALHFRNKLDFFFEFVPQIVLMLALFGWMDILIIAKWLYPKDIESNFVPDDNMESDFNKVNKAPAIITTMIDMFLKLGDNHKPDGNEGYYYLIPGQRGIGVILLIVAFASVPAMLCVKP
jgi:V-type H+-transporting ATPase subunit a